MYIAAIVFDDPFADYRRLNQSGKSVPVEIRNRVYADMVNKSLPPTNRINDEFNPQMDQCDGVDVLRWGIHKMWAQENLRDIFFHFSFFVLHFYFSNRNKVPFLSCFFSLAIFVVLIWTDYHSKSPVKIVNIHLHTYIDI